MKGAYYYCTNGMKDCKAVIEGGRRKQTDNMIVWGPTIDQKIAVDTASTITVREFDKETK